MAQINAPRPIVFVVLVLLTGLLLWYAFFRSSTPNTTPTATSPEVNDLLGYSVPPDPRLTFETNFRNVKPDVHYVGDAACTNCHGEICKTYHAHPMGRSAMAVASNAPLEKYDIGANNPAKVGEFQLKVTPSPSGVVHTISAKDPRGNAYPNITRLRTSPSAHLRSYGFWRTP